MTTPPEALPERVRARVVAFAADALAALPVDHVPAALKRAAQFTPQKRVRIAGAQILALLASDDTFRERIGVQARARQATAAESLANGHADVDAAALGYLVRPEGWEALLADVAAHEQTVEAAADTLAGDERAARLEQKLAALRAEVAELREAARQQQDAARAELAELRRKLGEARAQLRSSRADADGELQQARSELARLEAESTAAQAENRRLRAQVERLEAELGRAQRTSRVARDSATQRARILLDTLLQAGQGLRQELGLPVVEGSPADLVEAEIAESGVRHSSGAASLPLDDPAHVRALLALPRMHLIVDGYNVTRAEWDESTLETQRSRLLRGLAPLAAQTGAEITVVFDGGQAETRHVVQAPRGVRVLFSPRGRLADDVIRDLVAAEPPGRPVGVVTSDREIVRDVTRQPGVRAVASRALVRLLT